MAVCGRRRDAFGVVYFAGDRAYKLSKPVNLGFLDGTEAGGLGGDAEPSAGFGEVARQVVDAIRPHGPEHVWRPSGPVMVPD